MTKHLLDIHHMDELKKFAVDNLFSWSLKSRTGITQLISHVLGSRALKKGNCHYRISSIGYWGKGSTVGW